MSLNTLKRRSHLYSNTLLKLKTETRLSSFERTAIENSLSIHKFLHFSSEANLKEMAETISDFETMVEVVQLTFAKLRPEIDKIKKEKLRDLERRMKEKEIKEKDSKDKS